MRLRLEEMCSSARLVCIAWVWSDGCRVRRCRLLLDVIAARLFTWAMRIVYAEVALRRRLTCVRVNEMVHYGCVPLFVCLCVIAVDETIVVIDWRKRKTNIFLDVCVNTFIVRVRVSQSQNPLFESAGQSYTYFPFKENTLVLYSVNMCVT